MLNYFGVVLVALLGCMLLHLALWLKSKEAFDWRKFGYSAIRSAFSAVSLIKLGDYAGDIPGLYIAAFVGGAGIDAVLHELKEAF